MPKITIPVDTIAATANTVGVSDASPAGNPAATPTTADRAVPAESTEGPVAKVRLDPTRYGDWELNGKCVDF